MNILGSPDTHRCTELDLKNSNTSIHSVNWGSFSWKLCTMRSLRRLFPLILLANVRAARRGVPHPHQGKLKPFEPGPPSVKLSGADQAKVDGGELVMRQTVIDGGSSGRATAIQAVHAPPRLVWKQLLDLNAYPSKVEKLTECSKYFEKARGVGSCGMSASAAAKKSIARCRNRAVGVAIERTASRCRKRMRERSPPDGRPGRVRRNPTGGTVSSG